MCSTSFLQCFIELTSCLVIFKIIMVWGLNPDKMREILSDSFNRQTFFMGCTHSLMLMSTTSLNRIIEATIFLVDTRFPAFFHCHCDNLLLIRPIKPSGAKLQNIYLKLNNWGNRNYTPPNECSVPLLALFVKSVKVVKEVILLACLLGSCLGALTLYNLYNFSVVISP